MSFGHVVRHRVIIATRDAQKEALVVDLSLTVKVKPNVYVAAVSQLLAEMIYWSNSKSCGKYK